MGAPAPLKKHFKIDQVFHCIYLNQRSSISEECLAKALYAMCPKSDFSGAPGCISRANFFTKNAFGVDFKPPSSVKTRKGIYSEFEILIKTLFDSSDEVYIANSTSQFIFVANYTYKERIVNALLCEWVRKYFVNCSGMTIEDVKKTTDGIQPKIEAIVAQENVQDNVEWKDWIEQANKLRSSLNSFIQNHP